MFSRSVARRIVLAAIATAIACVSASAPAAQLFEKKARCKLPDPPGTSRPAEPAKVYIGMHVLRLVSLDITNNQFSLDFWLWFRWTDDNLKPYESFELTNGKIESRNLERVEKVGNVNYACVRVQATMTSFWDVSRFPFGRQKLTVEIEDDDLDSSQLAYLIDNANCGVDGNFRVSGWRFQGFSSEVSDHVYSTNYGDPSVGQATTRYCRPVFTIDLCRADIFHSFKIFSGLYLSALVAFTVFFVKADHRLGLIVGAVFSVVASHTVISSYLPEAGVLTLADKLHLVTAVVILASLFETAYSLHLLHHKRDHLARRMDRLTFCITAPLFLLANIWLLLG